VNSIKVMYWINSKKGVIKFSVYSKKRVIDQIPPANVTQVESR